jgi:hypothetical protein
MAVSKYRIDLAEDKSGLTPGFRTTINLDFFRNEPGSVYKPDIFDDGNMAQQNPDTLKFFLDPSADDATV